MILFWADLHYGSHGKWPNRNSGRVLGTPDQRWDEIVRAMRQGRVDDPDFAGRSLAWVLRKCRRAPCRSLMPNLQVRWILEWAVDYFELEGEWPTAKSGPIDDVPGETWRTVDNALRKGRRGMPGGSSLAEFLAKRRRQLNRIIRYRKERNNPEFQRQMRRRKRDWFRCDECRHEFWAYDRTGDLDCSECPKCPFGIVWNRSVRRYDSDYDMTGYADAHPDCDGDYPLRGPLPL